MGAAVDEVAVEDVGHRLDVAAAVRREAELAEQQQQVPELCVCVCGEREREGIERERER